MPRGARCSLGAALLLGLAGILPVRAEEAASPPARPWTDPPARGSAATPAPAPQAENPIKAAEPSAPSRPAGRAAVAQRKAGPSRAALRVGAPAHRPVRTARLRERTPVVRVLHPTRAPVRVARAPRFAPYAATPVRYPYAASGPVPAVYGYTVADERLRRIREAQSAGYIVLRQRSVVFPDGRSLRTYRPYEVEDDEE
ncbi:hypothetical protein J2X36_000635 [Methylobacterium sp. BE186]|uniref:hypothetical protein n=1 Tax=Methylobacterium sp. BE186 TaxID=2817715 RepID=UPI00286167CC|nr:hypothetical protein [Methylobacterium sp. BE186]MDR7035899.1 hypothetical protein [Methylobacterium sp. BE186]